MGEMTSPQGDCVTAREFGTSHMQCTEIDGDYGIEFWLEMKRISWSVGFDMYSFLYEFTFVS